jgi:hypothetical protein
MSVSKKTNTRTYSILLRKQYCDNNGKTEDQAIQTYNLGKIYYDLNRYTDARESLQKVLLCSIVYHLQFNLPTPTIILAFPIVEKKS